MFKAFNVVTLFNFFPTKTIVEVQEIKWCKEGLFSSSFGRIYVACHISLHT